MIDNYKVGNQIALLRKSKGLTGERFAELLNVSPQAVSKWENGKCLPETSLLPLVAQILGTSIDSLLIPQELVILSAVFSDGLTSLDVTRILNNNINGNKLYMAVNSLCLGTSIDSNRISVLLVKYQTPNGIYFDYKVENEYIAMDLKEKADARISTMDIIGAYYGNKDDNRDCMVKMKHYDYFEWNEIHVNHESFPSSPKTDEKEYLTLIYTNAKGIHVISCEENETLCFSKDKKEIYVKDTSSCTLPDIEPLEWEKGMDCTWAGSLCRALNYMQESYTYEQIMGMSGACYRIAFTDIWDWSAVDALVAFDYSTILFKAIGYEQIWADRLSKEERIEERKRIVHDIRNGKPVIAINLRIAPEWGVITGFKENGKILLCRTYFDTLYLNEKQDYLETDLWPFLITHFGDRTEKPSEYEILITSLKTLVNSFHAPCERGYYQGEEAYKEWIRGLSNESIWDNNNTKEDIDRRIGVNDATLLNLVDARRCAMIYLKNSVSLLPETMHNQMLIIIQKYEDMVELISNFRSKSKDNENKIVHYNEIDTRCNSDLEFRREQVAMLNNVVELEGSIVQIISTILDEGKSL